MIKKFRNKEKVFDYLKKTFSKSKIILIRGSSAKKPIKNFSDIDVEIYSNNPRKPYYEIVFIRDMPVLISAYFYKFKKGDILKTPNNIKIINGEYNKSIKPDFSKEPYNNKEKIKRECQLAIDFMFKYLRTKNASNLKPIQRRIQ